MYEGIAPVPDRVFVKDLKVFDPELRVTFHRPIGKFVVSKRRAIGSDFVVLVIETDDGQFRMPDQRDIKALYNGDLWRHGGVKERIRSGEEHMKAYRDKEEKEIETETRARAADSKIQLSNAFRKTFNEGSKAPELRRVDLNQKGLTVEQIRSARAAGQDPWVGQKAA
jgi:hypothetical protein